jgi:chaperonin cofactor prefoldin
VLETLKPLAEDRKCFRMINGVLVERTVKDMVPALETNSDGLKKVLDDLLKQYTTLQNEMEKWKVFLYGIHGKTEADKRNRKRITFKWCSNEPGHEDV